MSRIRTVKPEFFKHEDLYDLERDTDLPVRLAFIALWTAADREGRFKWRPRTLKVECLPHDECDFSRVLDALATRGFVVKYACDDQLFGYIPSFNTHQVINNRESPSVIPDPNEINTLTRAPRVADACPTPLDPALVEGKGREQEGKGKDDINPNGLIADADASADVLKFERDRNKLAEARARLRLLGLDWNSMASDLGLPQIEEIDPGSGRERSALARIREGRDFPRAFTKIRESPFLRGDRGSTPCCFDWIMIPKNFVKIIEGNYNEIRKNAAQQRSYGGHR